MYQPGDCTNQGTLLTTSHCITETMSVMEVVRIVCTPTVSSLQRFEWPTMNKNCNIKISHSDICACCRNSIMLRRTLLSNKIIEGGNVLCAV